jgi:hypothetical protein
MRRSRDYYNTYILLRDRFAPIGCGPALELLSDCFSELSRYISHDRKRASG